MDEVQNQSSKMHTLEKPSQKVMRKPSTDWSLSEPTQTANTICPCDLSRPATLVPKFDKSYNSLSATKQVSVCKCLSCNSVMAHRALIQHCFVDSNQRLICQTTLKPADGGTDKVPPPFYRVKATWPSYRDSGLTSVRFVLDTKSNPIYPVPDGLQSILPRMSFPSILREKIKAEKLEPLSTHPAAKRKGPHKIKDFYEDRCEPQAGPSSAPCFNRPLEESGPERTPLCKVTKSHTQFLNMVYKRNAPMFMSCTSSVQPTSAQEKVASIFSKWDLSKRNFSQSNLFVEDNKDDVIITHDKPYSSAAAILKQGMERSSPVPSEEEEVSNLPLASQTEADKNVNGAT